MSSVPAYAPVAEILAAVRENVMGVSETVLSTVDGLLVAADTEGSHPESVAALSASAHSIGRRLAAEAGGGALRELVTRSAGRHVVIEAVGERALLTVIGDEGLDMAGLGRELLGTVERLEAVLRGDTPA
ncbi:roadblock/LC7 domain-containing protein [Streptomyces sp. NPDC048409]|uniref:roadblock/LC7 domain-containing protein n=1 Tax=Streptomyces sp. NPDC048409 TaxID=3154723 RepID=UPI00343BF233